MENYFNYFTEIEECYRRCRNTPSLLSPLDWALIESWKEAGVPLEAVLIGIERAFAKFQKRPRGIQKVNSLAYCTQAVLAAAEELNGAASGSTPSAGSAAGRETAPPFNRHEILDYLVCNGAAVEKAAQLATGGKQNVLADDLVRAASSLRETAGRLESGADQNLEEIEHHLSALEDMLNASLMRASDIELLTTLRGQMESGLRPYRRNMSAAQIESLERQMLKKLLFEHYHIPRLSLFYL